MYFLRWDWEIICFLRQGEYEDLSDRLKNTKAEHLHPEERQKFDLYKGIADIHTNGSLEASLAKALKVWGSLKIPIPYD